MTLTKKLILLFVLCFLILIKIGFSTLIEVGVSEDIGSKIISETSNANFNVVKFSTEFYNIGSVPYSTRERIFVYNDSDLLFSGWSQEKNFMSGDKKTFDIYWYASSLGNYTYKLKFYFGNEINESETKEFQVRDALIPEDVFEMSSFRTYDDHVIFDLKSKSNAQNVIIIPYKYTPGWIFEQKTIDSMKNNTVKTISLPYSPTVWEPATLKLLIVSNNGKYYSEKTVEMKKETGIVAFFYYIWDNLKLIL